MILIWNNKNSFNRHLEEMKTFSQSHINTKTEVAEILKDMPILLDVKPPRETGLIKSLTNNKGKLIYVPVWKITQARCSQN